MKDTLEITACEVVEHALLLHMAARLRHAVRFEVGEPIRWLWKRRFDRTVLRGFDRHQRPLYTRLLPLVLLKTAQSQPKVVAPPKRLSEINL